MTYGAITRSLRIGVGLAGAVALLAVGGCGGESQTAQSPSTVTVISTETTTATATAKPSESSTAAPESTPGTTTSTSNDEATFLMPNLVGKVLQTAQDEMQRVSGNPVFYTSSTDATGAGRRQIRDRNWVVCSQSVPPGTVVPVHGRTIDFSVVKTGETCP